MFFLLALQITDECIPILGASNKSHKLRYRDSTQPITDRSHYSGKDFRNSQNPKFKVLNILIIERDFPQSMERTQVDSGNEQPFVDSIV